MVWDLEHKWHASGRYAGREIAPGHFFSTNVRTAKAERGAYPKSDDDSVLLAYTVSIDNLLDLTDKTALSWFYKEHFEPDRDWHWALILDSLFHQQLGGDSHNAFAGHRALLDGYNGIIFFSVRGAETWWADPGSMRSRNWDLVGSYHDGLVERGRINVVIFFGHNVVRSTHRIASSTTVTENPLFHASMDEIDRVFADDPLRPKDVDLSYSTLRQRAERIGWVQTPRIVEELLSARTGEP
jgi:hypothetical protein